jgi:hypothetical protein
MRYSPSRSVTIAPPGRIPDSKILTCQPDCINLHPAVNPAMPAPITNADGEVWGSICFSVSGLMKICWTDGSET